MEQGILIFGSHAYFAGINLNKSHILVIAAVIAVVAGLLGYTFIPGAMCTQASKPTVELVYLYLEVRNVSASAPYVGNRTVVSFTAEISVKNSGSDTIKLSQVALSLPGYVSTIHEGGAGTYTITIATTVPGGQVTMSPSLSGKNTFVGALLDALNYTRQVSYSIPPGNELRLVIAGASLIPKDWENKFVSSWLHGGRWAYLVTTVSVETCGGAVTSSILTNASLIAIGPGGYYYVSSTEPLLINSSKTAELIQP